MALFKSKKVEMVKELEDAVKNAGSMVFLNFHKLDVGAETELRTSLREKNVNYKVFRKTLIKRALKDKATGELPSLEGEVAVAWGEDQIAPAREAHEFLKSHKGKLRILGGIFEGGFMDEARMMEIATIPGREVLLSKLAFLLKSPMQRVAIAVNEVAKARN